MYGPVVSINILRDMDTLVSRGMAFVCFTTPAAAQNAVLHMRIVYGRPVVATLANGYSSSEGTRPMSPWQDSSSCASESGYILAAPPSHVGMAPAMALPVPHFGGHVSYPPTQFVQATTAEHQPPCHWDSHVYSAIASTVGHGMPPYFAGAAVDMQLLVSRSINRSGCVNINGTVYFEQPSQKELDQQNGPWIEAGVHGYPTTGWM
jgi:RNA recognition motif-containing protein